MSEYFYLLISTKIRPGDCNNKLKETNMKLNEENDKALVMVNGQYRNNWRFSSNKLWKNIGCLVSDPTFDLGGSRLWKKEESKR